MAWDAEGYEIDDYTGQRTGNVAPGSAAEAATYTGSGPTKGPKSQGAKRGARIDYHTPPPGVSQTFWDSQVNDPANANAIKALEKGQAPKGYASAQDWLDTASSVATSRWKNLPEAQKKKFTDSDAGSGLDPNSPEGAQKEVENTILEREALGNADYTDFDPNYVANLASKIAQGDEEALAKLKETIDGIKDPEIAAYVGDYAAQLAHADPRDIEAQQRQLSKLEMLSDPRLTAEEKLMMEMSRQDNERFLRGQRGAQANDLQARGMYGSGAELTMAANSQAEAANRHALELLGAQSNASKRAMESLFGAKDLSTSMRQSSADESQYNASAMNRASEFNKTLLDGYNQWKDKVAREANRDIVGRAVARHGGQLSFGQNTINNALTGQNAKITGIQAKAAPREQATKDLIENAKWGVDRIAGEDNEDKVLNT